MMRYLRSLLFASALTACGVAPEGPSETVETQEAASSLTPVFREAAETYDVPQPLLEAMGFTATHWRMRPDIPSLDGGYGLMHLVDAGPEGPLACAARLTGLPEATLRRDARANVQGAAALLRDAADRYFRENPAKDPALLADWWQVVMRASGSEDPAVADAYATSVYAIVRRGARAELEDGTLHVLTPHLVEVEHEKLFGRMQSALTPDYALAQARPAASTNYTKGRGVPLSRLVIHTAQGPYTSVFNWFANPAAKASAHYVVSSGGDVAQMVPDADTAWHAGNWTYNQTSIGIEHEGYVDDASWLTDDLYTASANLSKWLCDTHGIPKDRAHVIGHYEVPHPSRSGVYGGKGGHTDPCVTVDGKVCHWDWNRYMGLLNGRAIDGTTPPVPGDQPPQPKVWRLLGYVFDSEGCPVPKASSTACRPVAGAVVTVTSPRDAGVRAEATVDERGVYAFDVVEGDYTVTVAAPGFDSSPASTATRRVPSSPTAATTYASLLLDRQDGRATVTGYVHESVDGEEGPRIAGAEVSFGARVATTAGDGTFTLTTLPEGVVGLRVSGPRHRAATFEVTSSRTPSLWSFGLLPAGKGDGGSGLDEAMNDASESGSGFDTGWSCTAAPTGALALVAAALVRKRRGRR